jgi:hypothetical protein
MLLRERGLRETYNVDSARLLGSVSKHIYQVVRRDDLKGVKVCSQVLA